jgi:hypothetical protein
MLDWKAYLGTVSFVASLWVLAVIPMNVLAGADVFPSSNFSTPFIQNSILLSLKLKLLNSIFPKLKILSLKLKFLNSV